MPFRSVRIPLLLLLAVAGSCYAQVTAGTIRGLLTDSSGAPVPNVEVRAIHFGTGRQLSTRTTEAGVYVLGNAPVGEYRIQVEAPGFKSYSQQPVVVGTATTTSLDISLEVGQITEAVTVEGAYTPLLQTDNSEVSTVMEQKLVIDLPMDLGGRSAAGGASGRRQIETFVFLTPGVTGDLWNKHFLGSPQHTAQSVIEGIPLAIQESPGRTSQVGPPVEAIQEFKVSTTLYSADQGRGLGIANYTFKSGSNEFHGNAFWFLRNDKLDARGRFRAARPITRQNEYGGTFGGPILGNKLFFFGAYTGFKRRGGALSSSLATIPAMDFRQGNFSRLVDGAGVQIPIYDPNSTRSDGAGGFVRTPFEGNIIPANRISRVAADAVKLLPAPDSPGIVNNWVNRAQEPTNDDVWSVKTDYNLRSRQHLSFSYWWVHLDQLRYAAWGVNPVDTGYIENHRGGGLRANYDFAIRPTLLNHFAWGYSRQNKDRLPAFPVSGNIFNIPNISVNTQQAPLFAPPGYLSWGGAQAGPDLTRDDAHIFTDTLSWVKGRHQIRFGGEYWDQSFSRFDGRNEAGTYNFDRLSTSQPNSPNFGRWGDAFASFLLGEVYSGNFLVNPTRPIYDTRYLAFFFEDKLQVTPKLTLSLGIRYDLPWPIREREDRISGVDLYLPNSAAAGRPGAFVFGNDAAGPKLHKTEWAPRVAAAYQINRKTVLRSGFGIIYAQANALVSGTELGGNALLAGFTGTSSPVTLNQGITPAFRLDEGPPPAPVQFPNLSPTINVGGVGDYLNAQSGTAPHTVSYNFTIQRELPFGIYTDFAYVGAKSSHLPANLENPNQVPARYLSLGPLLNANINSAAAMDAGIMPTYPGFSGSVAQALRPYPQYTSLVAHASPIGNSTYQSFQLKVQKRYSSGLSFLTSYTLSKTITDTSGNAWSLLESAPRDTANLGLEKSVAPFDNTHNLIANFVYELPGRTLKGAKAALLRGWQAGGTIVYTSGPPISISGGPPLPLFGGPNRPSRVPGVDRFTGVSKGDFDPDKHRLLNIAAYRQPAPFTMGDVGRVESDLRGFTFWNESMTFMKRTYIPAIREAFNIEFRAEFFNLTNRVVFSTPAANINNTNTFGVVSGQSNSPRTIQFGLKFNF